MVDSDVKFREIEKIYSEVVDKLDATTKLFNEFRETVESDKKNASQIFTTHPSQVTFNPQQQMYPVQQSTNPNFTLDSHQSHTTGHPIAHHQLSQSHNLLKPSLPTQVSFHGQTQMSPVTYPSASFPQSLCQTCPTEIEPQLVCVKSPTDYCVPNPCSQNADLGAAEVLMLLTDGYIQQCEGNPEQQENKLRLIKLRKKITLNRNCKPKTISKFMDYVQRIGAEVMKASCEQRMFSTLDHTPIKDNMRSCDMVPLKKPSKGSFLMCANNSSRSKFSNKNLSSCQLTQKPCVLNGMEAVSLGKVIPIGKLSDCTSMSQKQLGSSYPAKNGASSHNVMPGYSDCGDIQSNQSGLGYVQQHPVSYYLAAAYDNVMRKYTPSTDIREPSHITPQPSQLPYQNNQYLHIPQLQQPSYQSQQSVGHQNHSSPDMSQESSNYEHPNTQLSQLPDPHIQQQSMLSQPSHVLPTQTSYYGQDIPVQTSMIPQQDISTQPSAMMANQLSYARSNIATSQHVQPEASNFVNAGSAHPSQQLLTPQMSRLKQKSPSAMSRHKPLQQLTPIQSERVLSSFDVDNTIPEMNSTQPINRVQSQGTQYQEIENMLHSQGTSNAAFCVAHETPNKFARSVQKVASSRYALSRKQSSSDDERSETMIEKLERKSLNIPEGTLVTDGNNVYYITKPNDCEDNDTNEEVIVNIPIKGSHIVKPSGESQIQKCSSCGNTSTPTRNKSRRKSKEKAKKESVLDKLLLRLDSECSVDDDEDERPQLQSQKKKAKSHSTITDFEACICSDCFPDKEGQVCKVDSVPTTSTATDVPKETSFPALKPVDSQATKSSKQKIVIDAPHIPEQPTPAAKDSNLLKPRESHLNSITEEFSDAQSNTSLVGTASATDLPSAIEGKVVKVNSVCAIKKKECLEHIFKFLDLKSLTQASEVCHEWKSVARRPSLWKTLEITNERISSKFLHTISSWCTQMTSITLQGLKTPKKRKSDPVEKFLAAVQGTLEPGLEDILKASSTNITTITIIGCSNLFTDNILWSIGTHCPLLTRLAYISAHSPAGKESLWGLGTGCKLLTTLLLPPVVPCKYPIKFDDDSCEVIGRSWPNLKILSIGGEGVTANGLVTISKLCQELKMLELDKVLLLTKKVVKAMTYIGMKEVELIEINHTNISLEALKAFRYGCPKLVKLNFEKSRVKEETEENLSSMENISATRPNATPKATLSNQGQDVAPRPLNQIRNLHERRAIGADIPPEPHKPPDHESLSKEEQDNILEGKLLAAKRLNAETAQQLADNQQKRQMKKLAKQQEPSEQQRRSNNKTSGLPRRSPTISVSNRLTEQQRLSDNETLHPPSRSPTPPLTKGLAGQQRSRDKKLIGQPSRSSTPSISKWRNKTSEEWRETVKQANPEGLKLANLYEEPQNFHHLSLTEQLAQYGEHKTKRAVHRKENKTPPTS